MLHWALVFLGVAMIAGVFGFGGMASASAGIAQILFVVFLVLFAAALLMRLMRGAGGQSPAPGPAQNHSPRFMKEKS